MTNNNLFSLPQRQSPTRCSVRLHLSETPGAGFNQPRRPSHRRHKPDKPPT